VQRLEATDPATRSAAKELIECLMELHGAGLERMLEIVSASGEAGTLAIDSLGRDELVSSLLVLYGLHPEDFETRVQRALDKVTPALRKRGAGLEALAAAENTVHLRITGSGTQELEKMIREALLESAPDAIEVVIEGAEGQAGGSNFVPLASLQASVRVAARS
jgi:NifU-like domain